MCAPPYRPALVQVIIYWRIADEGRYTFALPRNLAPSSILLKASSPRWLIPCSTASHPRMNSSEDPHLLDDLNREPVIHTWTCKIDTVE
jgi:hypothetical protein